MRYLATLHAEFEIEAENIVEARRLAGKIKAIGQVIGCRRPEHNRDLVHYSVEKTSSTVKVKRER